MDWKTMLTYISGSVDDDLVLRNEYLAAENRILRAQIKGLWGSKTHPRWKLPLRGLSVRRRTRAGTLASHPRQGTQTGILSVRSRVATRPTISESAPS